jgi:hypothetical protein
MNAIAAHDPMDATSVKREYGDYAAQIREGAAGLRIAMPSD